MANQANKLRLIGEINEAMREVEGFDQAKFFNVNGFCQSFPTQNEKLWYPGCKSEGCMKKVFPDNGGYRCEKC